MIQDYLLCKDRQASVGEVRDRFFYGVDESVDIIL